MSYLLYACPSCASCGGCHPGLQLSCPWSCQWVGSSLARSSPRPGGIINGRVGGLGTWTGMGEHRKDRFPTMQAHLYCTTGKSTFLLH